MWLPRPDGTFCSQCYNDPSRPPNEFGGEREEGDEEEPAEAGARSPLQTAALLGAGLHMLVTMPLAVCIVGALLYMSASALARGNFGSGAVSALVALALGALFYGFLKGALADAKGPQG